MYVLTDCHTYRWMDEQIGRQTVRQTRRCKCGQSGKQTDSNKFKCMDGQIGNQAVRQTRRRKGGQTDLQAEKSSALTFGSFDS